MNDRSALIDTFLARAGWSGAIRRPLAGDASFRRYERVRDGARAAIVMDAPPPHEDVRPFAAMTRHLSALGYSVPTILAEDAPAGLLLLEDLGDTTYSRALAAGESEAVLYDAAVDVIADLHERPEAETLNIAVPDYDVDRLVAEAELLSEWYIPRQTGRPLDAASKESYRAIWRALGPVMAGAERTLVLRDFHADNLIWLPKRGPLRNCALLDYQDAVAGSPAYDLVSLIEDARRDLAPGLTEHLLDRYRGARPGLDWESCRASYVTLAAQRHCKVIGIFTRLLVRDAKPIYLQHIPRVWRLLETACRDPLLAPLREWLDRHIPSTRRGIPASEAII